MFNRPHAITTPLPPTLGEIHTQLESRVIQTSSPVPTTKGLSSHASTSMRVTSLPRRTALSYSEVLSPTAAAAAAAATRLQILR